MRGLIGFLSGLMVLLIGNIFLYSFSEEYRFFLKKMKYQDELIYDNVNDSGQTELLSAGGESGNIIANRSTQIEFLNDIITEKKIFIEDANLPELTVGEESFIKKFQSFDLKELETYSNIYGLTTEYPDPYYEYYSAGVSVYILATKSYEDVRDIFETLSFDLPFTLNEVNNFGDSSLYINLDTGFKDNYIRILMSEQNRTFGLKIRKDRYNEIKGILEEM